MNFGNPSAGKGKYCMKNNVAHSYNHKIALGIVDAAKNEFYQMFCDLRKEVETTWL